MAQTILLSGVGKSTCVLNPSFLEMCIVNTLCHMCAKNPGSSQGAHRSPSSPNLTTAAVPATADAYCKLCHWRPQARAQSERQSLQSLHGRTYVELHTPPGRPPTAVRTHGAAAHTPRDKFIDPPTCYFCRTAIHPGSFCPKALNFASAKTPILTEGRAMPGAR